jgi:hypothetical protein
MLCPTGCSECPEVEFSPNGVRIGEDENVAVLKNAEWNVLVEMIQSGQLTKV